MIIIKQINYDITITFRNIIGNEGGKNDEKE